MTVARCLEKFKREYAWEFKILNTCVMGIQDNNTGIGIPGYTTYKDMKARRHAYRMLIIWIDDLSVRQLKNLYQKILYWLEEVINY